MRQRMQPWPIRTGLGTRPLARILFKVRFEIRRIAAKPFASMYSGSGGANDLVFMTSLRLRMPIDSIQGHHWTAKGGGIGRREENPALRVFLERNMGWSRALSRDVTSCTNNLSLNSSGVSLRSSQ